VAPAFVEVKSGPGKVPASNLLPSADETTQFQRLLVGALVGVQVWAWPKFAPHQSPAIRDKIFTGFI
jgi:hypothetical protein